MLSESYTAVSTNRRKKFDGKKWLRVVGMLLVLLIIAFPFSMVDHFLIQI